MYFYMLWIAMQFALLLLLEFTKFTRVSVKYKLSFNISHALILEKPETKFREL